MLVSVVRLRRLGETLPPDELKKAASFRGHLFITRWRREVSTGGEPMGLVYRATLHEDDDDALPHLLPSLQQAFVSKIKHDGLLVSGIETHSLEAPDARYKQTWWCRLVGRTP